MKATTKGRQPKNIELSIYQNLTNCSQVLNKNFDDWAKIYKYVIWKQPPMEEDLQMFKQT